eukprot:TRINITY_DN18226_c0_g1_i1.p1 TRINITY_DN18226_c0_g1~~TRINITY_DN18226_c0_g1_i1.p1  ORF type:complete len:411 (+),score=95.54 TRINITY_DN18226_c0_g1_i1:44-1276(+)
MITSTVLSSIDSNFNLLHATTSEGLVTLHSAFDAHRKPAEWPLFVGGAVATFSRSLFESVCAAIKKFQPFFFPEHKYLVSHHPHISENICVKIHKYFLSLEELLLDCQDLDNRTDVNHPLKSYKLSPPFVFSLVNVARRVGGCLDDVIALVRDTFPIHDKPCFGVLRVNVDDLKQRFRMVESKLVMAYVLMEGRQLGNYMSKYLLSANWLRSNEPRSVGLAVKLFVQHVQEIDTVVSTVDSGGGGGAGGSGGAGGGGMGIGGAATPGQPHHTRVLSRGFFGKKLDIFAKVECSRVPILAAVTRVGLKTMCECVRLCTFGRCGFHQMQVDVVFLKDSLAQMVGDRKRDLDFFLEEAEVSAQRRCVDPVPFDVGVIHHILYSPAPSDMADAATTTVTPAVAVETTTTERTPS